MSAASTPSDTPDDIQALAKGGRTNVAGFALRLVARLPFLFIAGRLYGADAVGRFALAVVVVELAALLATLGLKRGLAQAFTTSDRPHVCTAWDGLAVAALASLLGSAVLVALPGLMYPHTVPTLAERLLPCIIVASAWSDVTLAALAYRRDVGATVTARAVVEPWTISIAALGFYYISPADGLVLAYMLSMLAALVASVIPFVRSYGWPRGWTPQLSGLSALARRNAPLAGADAIEWATRNVDRFILGLLFPAAVVGIYYMAQQVASLSQKFKTTFDPILGPVVVTSLAADDRAGVAHQVRQVAFWVMAVQTLLALMGSIPSEAVMGVVGPQFVAGATALAFLLTAEVLAAQGAVSEGALVYVARHLNLLVSGAVLVVQVLLSFALIELFRRLGWPQTWQAAGPALALAAGCALSSLVKGRLLAARLGARVSGWRWSLILAAGATALVGALFTALPHRFEWAELVIGEPAMFLTYALVIWLIAFTDEDRALFRRRPG